MNPNSSQKTGERLALVAASWGSEILALGVLSGVAV